MFRATGWEWPQGFKGWEQLKSWGWVSKITEAKPQRGRHPRQEEQRALRACDWDGLWPEPDLVSGFEPQADSWGFSELTGCTVTAYSSRTLGNSKLDVAWPFVSRSHFYCIHYYLTQANRPREKQGLGVSPYFLVLHSSSLGYRTLLSKSVFHWTSLRNQVRRFPMAPVPSWFWY